MSLYENGSLIMTEILFANTDYLKQFVLQFTPVNVAKLCTGNVITGAC